MGSQLEQYLASRAAGEGDAEHQKRRLAGFATENLHPLLPPQSTPFFRSLGAGMTTTWATLPDPVKVELAKLQPAVDRLGPNFDFNRLAMLTEKHKGELPTDAYFRMAGVAAIGISRQQARSATAAAQFGLVALNEAGRQATFGYVPAIPQAELRGSELSPRAVAAAQLLGTIAGLGLSGKLVYGALSKVTMLPKIGALLLELPQRVREITMGVGTAAILDAARPDGLPEEPANTDFSARMAHPLARMMGNSEVAQRAALALTGGITGGIIGELLGPVLRGIFEYRTSYFLASKVFTPEMPEYLRDRLGALGIEVKPGEATRSVIAKALRNLDRIGVSEKMATVVAEDHTRAEFILQQLYSDPAFSGPPRLPHTKVTDPTGAPMRVYRGETNFTPQPLAAGRPELGIEYYAETPEHANVYAMRPGVTEGGQRVTPVYLDIRNPLDVTEGTAPPPHFLDAYEKVAGTREFDTGDVIGSTSDVVEAARASGYDGIKYTVPPSYIRGGGTDLKSWIALNPRTQAIPAFASDDARLMAGIFRANPGGLSIVKGVTSVRAADELVQKLGLNVHAIKAGEDFLIMRPQVQFPIRPVGARLSKQIGDFTDYVRALNRGKPTSRMAILPDGSPVRGDYNEAELVTRYKLSAPKVEGAERSDIAVREHFGLVDVRVEQGGKVTVQLPSTITQRQASVLGRIADRVGQESEITIQGAKPGQVRTFTGAFGMQVEDQLADLVQGASKPKVSAAVMAKVRQYQTEGVFSGQAAHLPDGYPVEVIRRVSKGVGKEATIVYRDPLTRILHRVGENNISILPTSLEGEHAPTSAFFDALNPEERTAFANLRRGINEGFTKPIRSFGELETFASSKGKMATALGKGRVRLHDALTGETVEFENVRAATEYVRNANGPLPDLTPPEVEELLGHKPNFGGIGGNGPPHGFGEPIPIPDDEFDKAIKTNTLGMLGPGGWEQAVSPTKYLMQNLTRRYNMPFEQVWENLHLSTVNRNNFTQAWAYGRGPGLPTGVMPLVDIYKLAGRPSTARQELMTDLLEAWSDPAASARIRRELTPAEIKGVEELRKWYGLTQDNGLFKVLGIEGEYLTDYAPHIRSTGGEYGNDVSEIWRRTRGTPLPKSVDFFADYSRDGSMSIYEKRAFVAAARYLDTGARSRFMNSALTDAKRLLRAVPDNAVKAPLVNYLEALRGSEFSMQHAALDATFTRMMQSLGATEKVAKSVGERVTLGLLGASYSATMGFRPGLAVRHALKVYQTLWPLVGRMDDTFAEGIGRALTKVGRDDAIRAGAIAIKSPMGMFGGEEIAEAMPTRALKTMYNAGMELYNEADVLTRSISFNVAKLQSQKAIQEFAESVRGGTALTEAQHDLIRRSGAMVLTKTAQGQFLRLVASDPDAATNFMGRQISNVTEFLYGKGNQPRWMRTIPGRFFGQFGTFPLWYFNYVGRSFANMWRGGYQKEALAFIAKLGMVNMALYEAGKAVGLDLRKWGASHAMFYSGGPAVQGAFAALDLVRAAGESVFQPYTSPAVQERIATAQRTLKSAGMAFIPDMYVARDIQRLLNAKTPQEKLAAFLSVQPTQDQSLQDKMNLLFNPGRMSTDMDLESMDGERPTAAELMIMGDQMAKGRQRIPVPPPMLPPPPQQGGGPGVGQGRAPGAGKVATPKTAPVSGRPPMSPTALPPEVRSGESKPIP